MNIKSKAILILSVMFVSAVFAGCSATNKEPAGVKPYNTTVSYICKGCGNQIDRKPPGTQGFVDKCPSCGKQFLAF